MVSYLYYNETLSAQSLQLGKQSLAMGATGGVVVTLLISDQSQHCRQIQHGLGQDRLQEQADLSDAEREGGVRVQARHLIRCGQGT